MAGEFIEEIDYLLELDPSGLVVHDDGPALNQRISEWFETPQGTLIDKPWWGHNFGTFKHEPLSDNLNIMAEMNIMEKLPRDVQNVNIRAVGVEFVEIDRCVVKINYSLGTFSNEVAL